MILKKHFIIFSSILTLSISTPFFLSSCATAPQQESAGQYIDSSALTLKVKTKLLADKQIKSLEIKVNTYKNVVQLSGFVDNAYQKRRAVELARSVPGVEAVTDALIVKTH